MKTKNSLTNTIKLILNEYKYDPLYSNSKHNVSDKTYVDKTYLGKNKKIPEWAIKNNQKIIQNVLNQILKESKNWWYNWLKDPITIQKFYSIRGIKNPTESQINKRKEIWKEYFNILSKTSIVNENYADKEETDAYVDNGGNNIIHVVTRKFMNRRNGNQIFLDPIKILSDDKSLTNMLNYKNIVSTVIHEIQHLLYFYEPLNPEGVLKNLGSDSNSVEFVKTDKMKKTKMPLSKDIKISDKLTKYFGGLAKNIKKEWTMFYYNNGGPTNKYINDPNEMGSRIAKIRYLFKLKPGENITFNMIKPYILMEKRDNNVDWVLIYWASKKFPDIYTFLNNVNKLAVTKNQSKNIA